MIHGGIPRACGGEEVAVARKFQRPNTLHRFLVRITACLRCMHTRESRRKDHRACAHGQKRGSVEEDSRFFWPAFVGACDSHNSRLQWVKVLKKYP